MEYSAVTLMDKDKGRPASDFRTSQSAFVRAMDDITHALEARTASVTRIPKNHQEHTQVLRYGYTEKYSAHTDFFDPALYQQDPHTLRLIDNGRKNRLATVFWYLSDVEEGGHTVFPRFNAAPQPRSFDDCTKGLLVKPEKGKVIIFYSLLPDGRRDALSLHGACPVKEGIKWAANKWVWNAPMGYVN
jgi:prolyl 4-hydroxylase